MTFSIIGDAKYQYLNMSFTFDEQQDKIIVKAIPDHTRYQLQLVPYPGLDFENFKIQVYLKTPEVLKIKIPVTIFEFKNVEKLTLNTQKETISKPSNKRQAKYQKNASLCKIILIGDSGGDKTNLLSRFVQDSFSMAFQPTIGVQYSTKTVHLENKTNSNQIWDTAGQQRFRAITNAYYREAVGAIIVYNLTNSKIFQKVQKWLNQFKQKAQANIPFMLGGNKSDLAESRKVKKQIALDFTVTKKLIYLQTSASSDYNINQAFTTFIREIYKRMKQTPQQKKPLPDIEYRK